MNRDVKRFPQILYDRAAINQAMSPTMRAAYVDISRGAGGSASVRRNLSRREWRRAAAAMSVNMECAGIDPNPEVWQLFADKTLLAALGPMVGSVLIVDRDGFALAMSRMFARKRT